MTVNENWSDGQPFHASDEDALAHQVNIDTADVDFLDVAASPYNVTPATTNPEVQIQQAINDASINGVPEVVVSRPGTYIVDLHTIPGQVFYAAAIWAKANVKLTLKSGVIIKLKNSAILPVNASAAYIIGSDTTLKSFWNIEGGIIDGNASFQSAPTILAGLALYACRSGVVRNTVVRNIYGTASSGSGETLHFEATKCRDIHFIGCEADGSGSANTATAFSTNQGFGISWTDCVAHDMGFGMGFTAWMAAGLRYSNCHAYKNGASGFNAERSEGVVYSSCIAGGRSPFIEGTSENPYFPTGQTALGNNVGFSIQGCTDVVGVGIVSTRNNTNLSIYTSNPGFGLSALVNTRVVFVAPDLRNATTTEVFVETASTGVDQVEVDVIDALSGGGSVPDSQYNFSKAPLYNYTTGSSGVRRSYSNTTGGYLERWISSKVVGPVGGSAIFGVTPDGQLDTAGRRHNRRPTAVNTTVTLQDEVIAVTDTSVARTITLIAASAAGSGQTYTIKDESGGAAAHNITVARAGADLIEGATSKVITTNFGWVQLLCTGSAWVILGSG